MTWYLCGLLQRVWSFTSRVRRIVLWLVAISWAFHVWFRPAPPHWTSAVIPGGTNPIGFTEEGYLVTADGDEHQLVLKIPGIPAADLARLAPLNLTTWDLESGQIVAQVSRTTALFTGFNITTTNTCDAIITRISEDNPGGRGQIQRWAVLDRQTGQERFPRLTLNSSESPVISPNGRYAAFNDWQVAGSRFVTSLVDLQTGQIVASVPLPELPIQDHTTGYIDSGGSIFTEDSQAWIMLERDRQGIWVVFRSVPDGTELSRSPLPQIAKFSRLRFSHRVSGRIMLWAALPSPQRGTGFLCFEVVDRQFRRCPQGDQPAGRTDETGAESTVVIVEDGWKAMGTFRFDSQFASREPWVVALWNQFIGRRLPSLIIHHDRRNSGSVQYFQGSNDQPVGVPVEVTGQLGSNYVCRPRRDGRWFVDGGDRIRVYRTPPPERWTRLPGVLALLLLAWQIDRVGWSRRSRSLSETAPDTGS